MKGIYMILFLLFSSSVFGQKEIEFFPKALVKEAGKYVQLTASDLNEIAPLNQVGVNGKFFTINDIPNFPCAYIYIGRVNSCRAGGCSIVSSPLSEGASEYFDYFILYNKDLGVEKVKVFNYRATHGHGISAPGWLKQFVGYKGNTDLQVGKSIDAISGATISVNGITSDIQHKTRLLGDYFRRISAQK